MYDDQHHIPADASHFRGATILLAVWLICTALTGCASWTNPVANGVPVRILPEELLADSKEDFVYLPLTTLRQKRPKTYDLAPGDTLGIYIEGILGEAESAPPVNIPDSAESLIHTWKKKSRGPMINALSFRS